MIVLVPRWDADAEARFEVAMILARRRLHPRYFGGLVYDAAPYKILPPVGIGGRANRFS